MKLHRFLVSQCSITVLLITAILTYSSHAHAQTPQPANIAILPFEIHSSKDISYLKDGIRNMLASRLSANAGVSIIDKGLVDASIKKHGDIKSNTGLKKLGSNLNTDFLVTGSITSLGSALSIDAKVVDIDNSEASQNFYATANNDNEVIPAIDKLAADISAKVFGRQTASQAAVVQPAPQQNPLPAVQMQTAHPDRAFITPLPGAATATGPMAAKKAMPQSGQAASPFGFTKSQNFKMNLQAMDVGDVDGDGFDEIVLGNLKDVKVYKQMGERLQLFFRLPVVSRYKVHAVNLADLNNNGKAELYVSTIDVNEVRSFGGEWQGDKFDYFFKDVRWHVRPLNIPYKGMVLAGQRMSTDTPFMEGIFELEVTGSKVKQGKQLEIPEIINLYDFSYVDLDNDNSLEIVTINQEDRLRVYKPNGKRLWRSKDYFGGTTRYVGGKDKSAKTTSGLKTDEENDEVRVYLPTRMIIADINGDGFNDVIVNKNPPESSRAFQNLKKYPSGKIEALTWNGLGLVPVWEGDTIEGTVGDYQVRSYRNGETKLFVGVILNSDWLGRKSKAESTVVTYIMK